MKKMTQKEFKETFEAAGFDFSIWGWEGILNLISVAEEFQSKDAKAKGYDTLAERNQERSDAIYDALSARGYYESRI